MIRLDAAPFGAYLLVNVDAAPDAPEIDRDMLVQSDWERPGTALAFGWRPCHTSTDGTVDCPACGRTASAMIEDATTYLDDHVGTVAPDPGYFG